MVILYLIGCTATQKTAGENSMITKSSSITIALGNKGSLNITVKRLENNPIIQPGMDERMGSNINGPSLIRVPSWVKNPLGKYYLYFANHKGRYIRLAYADQIEGPWKIHQPGTLQLEDSHYLTEPPPISAKDKSQKERWNLDKPRAPNVPSKWADMTHPHIASPDVHVIEDRKEIRMYYHGLEKLTLQYSRVAVSKDGLNFTAHKDVIIKRPYLRVFPYQGIYYGMTMPGLFFRSKDGLTDFERGPQLFNRNMRHAALMMLEGHLLVFWTQVKDAPEHIKLSVIDMSGDFNSWKESPAVEVLRPEHTWEGADEDAAPSFRSSVNVMVNQLRDPAIFQENGRTFLLYATAGEAGIGIAELFLELKQP